MLYGYPKYRPPWKKPAELTPEDALEFLGVKHSNPLRDGELEQLMSEGFPFECLNRLDEELFLGEPRIWWELQDDPDTRQSKPNRLTKNESSRAFDLASSWLLAFHVFKSEVRARLFHISTHEHFCGRTAIQSVLMGGRRKKWVIYSLESLYDRDWIDHEWFEDCE